MSKKAKKIVWLAEDIARCATCGAPDWHHKPDEQPECRLCYHERTSTEAQESQSGQLLRFIGA